MELGVIFGFLREKDGIVMIANRIFEIQMYDLFLSQMAVESREKIIYELNYNGKQIMEVVV